MAGHQLRTRELEEAVQANPNIADVAVVGFTDGFKDQMPLACAVVGDVSKIAHVPRRV